MDKIKVSQDYERLSEEIQEQIKLVYPDGFTEHLIEFTNKENKRISALRFETDEKIYLVRMTLKQARQIVADDDDYDSDGSLYDDVKDDYEEKYGGLEYMTDNDNYGDD